jgi:hypothetical protein
MWIKIYILKCKPCEFYSYDDLRIAAMFTKQYTMPTSRKKHNYALCLLTYMMPSYVSSKHEVEHMIL